jgi:probable rRNA maturation factor
MPTKKTRNKNNVAVQFAVPRRGVPSAASFRRWALGFSGITLRIVGNRESHFLNRKYRGKGKPTNVLSFPYGDGEGDVVLCNPLIAREARAQRKTLAAHYAHLVVHGILHLRGYDHETKRDAARMERAETRILRRLGFGNPYELE